MVVIEHTPPHPAGLTACIIRKYTEREDGEGRDRSQKCGSKKNHGLKMREPEGGEAGAEMARNSGSQLLLSSSHQVA